MEPLVLPLIIITHRDDGSGNAAVASRLAARCNALVRIFQMSKTMIKTVHTPLFFYCATLIEYIDYYGAITS